MRTEIKAIIPGTIRDYMNRMIDNSMPGNRDVINFACDQIEMVLKGVRDISIGDDALAILCSGIDMEVVEEKPLNIRKNAWGEYRVPDPDGRNVYLTDDKEDAINQAHYFYPERTIKLNGKIV